MLTDQGEAKRSGYLYRIYLPSTGGGAVGEPVEGFSDRSGIDPDLAETNWCMYAWPVKYGVTGKLTFMTNTGGDVVATAGQSQQCAGFGAVAMQHVEGPEAIYQAAQIMHLPDVVPANGSAHWQLMR